MIPMVEKTKKPEEKEATIPLRSNPSSISSIKRETVPEKRAGEFDPMSLRNPASLFSIDAKKRAANVVLVSKKAGE